MSLRRPAAMRSLWRSRSAPACMSATSVVAERRDSGEDEPDQLSLAPRVGLREDLLELAASRVHRDSAFLGHLFERAALGEEAQELCLRRRQVVEPLEHLGRGDL